MSKKRAIKQLKLLKLEQINSKRLDFYDHIPDRCEFTHHNFLYKIKASRIQKQQYQNPNYFQNIIGEGYFGTIEKVSLISETNDTGQTKNLTIAIKKIRLNDTHSMVKHKILEHEIAIKTSKFKCPHIIQYFGSLKYLHNQQLWILMEKMDICLYKFNLAVQHCSEKYTSIQPVNLNFIKKLTFSLVEGLDFLKHEIKVIHRDIKPSNILINRINTEIKICDFGIASNLVASKRTYIGTFSYMSPEMSSRTYFPSFSPDGAGAGTGAGARSPNVSSSSNDSPNVKNKTPHQQITHKFIKKLYYTDTADVWAVGLTIGETISGEYMYFCHENLSEQEKTELLDPQNKLDLTLKIVKGPSPTLSRKIRNLHIYEYFSRNSGSNSDNQHNHPELQLKLDLDNPKFLFSFIEDKCLRKNVDEFNGEPVRPNYSQLKMDPFYQNIVEHRWDEKDLQKFTDNVFQFLHVV